MINGNNKKIDFCCIFGGKSSEYEVSLKSAYGVLENTDSEKYNITRVGITKDGRWFLYNGENENIKNGEWINGNKKELVPCALVPGSKIYLPEENRYINIDVCFPVVHGGNCEDGKLQGFLDICGVKYVGPGCTSSAVCMDKDFTKGVLERMSVPMAAYKTVIKGSPCDKALVKSIIDALGLPVFVKPANAGSSVGASIARNEDEILNALLVAFKEDKKVLVEEYIKAKEVEVAVMGSGDCLEVSMPGEIDPGAVFYDYDTKYNNDTAKYYIPARLPEEILAKVRSLAKTVYESLGCKGLSRVDFFVTKENRIVFNEINTLPGFTTISMYPKMFMALGMSYPQIVDKLLTNAINGK